MMKKLITTITAILAAGTSFAEWNLDFGAGDWFTKDGTQIQEELYFAVIIDMNNYEFSGLKLSAGDSFAEGSFINSDNKYMTMKTGKLTDPDGEGYFLAYSYGWRISNDDYGAKGGEETAIIVWSNLGEKSYILSAGDSYTIVTPSLAGGELSGGFKWEMPTSDVGAYGWYLYNEHIEGTIPNSFTTLSQTVSAVPEPSTYAAIFGAVALGFAAYRRRK